MTPSPSSLRAACEEKCAKRRDASAEAEPLEPGTEVVREGGGGLQGGAGGRVQEAEVGGVEELAGDFLEIGGARGEVLAVAQDRRAGAVEVDADLVGAAGLDADRHVGRLRRARTGGDDVDVAHRRLAVDAFADVVVGLGGDAGDEGVVEFADVAVLEFGDEGAAGFFVLGEEDAAGGVFVEPVDGAQGREVQLPAEAGFEGFGSVGQEGGGLVGDQEMRVVEKDADGRRRGGGGGVLGDGAGEEFDGVAGLQQVAGHPDAAAVDEDEAVVEEGLGGAPGAGEGFRQVFLEFDAVAPRSGEAAEVFCAECGAKMYNHRKASVAIKEGKGVDPVSGLYPQDCFNCSAYTLSVHRLTKRCTAHHISTRALRELLLHTIRTVSAYAISNEDEFVEKVRAASEVRQQETAKELKRKLNRDRKRSAELDGLIKKLYEAYATGKLSEKRFETLVADYEREQETLEEVIAKGQEELDAFNADTVRVDQFMALARKYTDFTELTTPMIFEFVDKIIVHKADKTDGERTQEVEIFLKFIGKFDVPMPEPTPEELAEQERIRRHRAANRAWSRRYREKKKREKLEAAANNQDTESDS